MRCTVLALSFALLGGLKLGYIAPVAQEHAFASSGWRALLVGVGLLELALAVGITYGPTRAASVRWCIRLLAMFGAAQVLTDLIATDFFRNCGCFGPAISVGPTYRLLIVGGLLILAASALQSAAAVETREREPV